MEKVPSYHVYVCVFFSLFTVCLGTTCYGYDWYGDYTYLTCSYGCCGTTSYRYCCSSSSWTSWSSWSALSSVTTTTGGVSIGLIVGCSIAGIVVFVSIVIGIVVAVYKSTQGNRMVRPGIINNIASTNASGQHPANLSQNQVVSNSAYPPNPAGPSQIPSNYMYPQPPPAPVYPAPVPPPYEPQAPQK